MHRRQWERVPIAVLIPSAVLSTVPRGQSSERDLVLACLSRHRLGFGASITVRRCALRGRHVLLRWPDHAVARAVAALEVRRARIALADPVVPHPTAALGAGRNIAGDRRALRASRALEGERRRLRTSVRARGGAAG